MTTIVCDGSYIATDTRRTRDDEIDPFDRSPKLWVRNGVIFAACGLTYWPPAFIEWYSGARAKESYPKLEGDDATECSVAVYDGSTWRKYAPDSPYPEDMPRKWAMGTGTPYALAAMLCRKSAAGAVRIAMQLDTKSGGKVLISELSSLVRPAKRSNKAKSRAKRKRNRIAISKPSA